MNTYFWVCGGQDAFVELLLVGWFNLNGKLHWYEYSWPKTLNFFFVTKKVERGGKERETKEER